MPYQPVAINNPGIAPGINALSGAVEDWQKKRKEDERLQGYNDAVIQHAFQAGRISQDELNKYNAASLTQKTGIAAGYAAGLHEDLQQQQMAEQKQFHADSLANAIKVAQIHAGAASGGGPFNPQTFQLTDPISGKPFAAFSRGPHQVDLTPDSAAARLPAAGTPVYADDGSQIGVWTAKGGITKKTAEKAEDPMKAALAAMITGQPGAPAPTPAPAPVPAPPAPDLKALAQKALNDPRATPEQKAAARKILGQ